MMILLAVIKKDLRLLLRDRGQLMFLFLTPLAFIIPISVTFPKDGYILNPDFKPPLPVVIHDTAASAEGGEAANGEHVQELLDFLIESFEVETDFSASAQELGLSGEAACSQSGPACDELIAVTLVEKQERNTALVIPAGFSASIEDGQRVTMTLYYNPVGDAIDRQIHEAVIKGGASQLSIQNQVFSGFEQFEDLSTFAPESIQDAIEDEQAAAEEGAEQQPALSVVTVHPSSFVLEKQPDTYQQTIPGYTVMFVFFLVGFLRATINMEQNNGTFRRLLSTPVSRSQLLAGKMFSALLVGVMQVFIMFAIGHFLFGMGLGRSPAALILLTVSVALAAVGIGLAAASFNLANVLSVPLIVAALIGGCMFPVDWLPQFVRTIAYAVPHSWAMTGYQDILVRGHGLVEVLPSIVVLLGFAVVFFAIAVRRLEFE
jgi:ABC-2 type transport system permease protein